MLYIDIERDFFSQGVSEFSGYDFDRIQTFTIVTYRFLKSVSCLLLNYASDIVHIYTCSLNHSVIIQREN